MGGVRPTAATSEVFEPADPARTMPKWLVFGAIAAVLVLVLVMSWLNERSFRGADETPADATATAGAPEAAAPAPAPASPAAAAQGPVAITANEPVWLQVYEKGGAKLFEGVLAAGQRYDVPATATAPMLRTGKPEALRISVGTADAPPVGPPATTVRDVSLLGPDLLRGPAATTPAPVQAPAGTPPPVGNTAG
jgi:hypothetical protein